MDVTFTNVLNHPNFLWPDPNIGSPAFGKALWTSDPRVGQLGARLDW
ncbi:MAG: hypothetical protein IT165_00120 [Bryobacterales bacterium]|nr:hypothetical protein [Bryobacterales bacterium]